MKKYLLVRILVLVLFFAAIILMPFAAMIGMVIAFMISGISIYYNAKTNLSFSPRETIIAFLIGVVVFFSGFYYLGKLSQNPDALELFVIGAFCVVLIYSGLKFFKSFVSQEDNFYISSKVNNVTKFYPTLMIISGGLRLVIEIANIIVSKNFPDYIKYLNMGRWIGIVLFIFAIVQYIIRMIHIYKNNK